MGKFSFSLLELRLFSLIVSMIDDRDEDFKVYKIAVKDIMKTFNLKSKTIYAEIQQITTSMLKKIIIIPIQENGIQKEIKSTLMSSFKYEVSGRGFIEATFNPILKPYLLQLKNRFLLYNLSNILQIGSATSIRIFELLKTFEGVGQKTFSLQELKEILGVENNYSKYSNFKTKILLKSQKDLEMFTDIRFTFKEISENSRRVEKIQFLIHPNNPKWKKSSPNDNITTEECPNNNSQDIHYGEMLSFGLSEPTIKNDIFWKYEENYILKTITHCKSYFKKNKVESKAWFFIKALEKGFYSQEIESEDTRVKNQEARTNNLETEEAAKQKEALARDLKLQKLREVHMTEKFILDVLESYQWNFIYNLMKKDYDNGKINKFLQAFIDKKLLELE